MKKPLFFGIISFFVLGLMVSADEAITVTNTKGQSIQIEVLRYSKLNKNVKMKRISDGAVLTVGLNVFDEASQKKIVAAAPKETAKLEVRVSPSVRRKDVNGSSYMKTQTITTKTAINNSSLEVDFTGGKGSIIVLARSTKRYANRSSDLLKVLQRVDFPVNVASRGSFEYKSPEVRTTYDSDKDKSNTGGMMYHGWVLVLRDSSGGIKSVSTSVGEFKKPVASEPEKVAKQFLNLKKNSQIGSDLTAKGN